MSPRIPLFAFTAVGLFACTAPAAESSSQETPVVMSDPSVPIPSAPAPALPQKQEERQLTAFQRLRSWSDERLSEFYENVIVDPQNLHKFGARPQPHFGDLLHSDYTRLDLRYFYGFADKIEGEATFDNYFPTPGRHVHGIGFAQVTAGVRYRWVPSIDPTGKATTGFEMNYPIHDTPKDFTDGVNRFTLSTSYARTSTWIPNFEEFLGLSYTVITPSGAIGSIDSNLPQNDYVSFTIGWLRHAHYVTYGFTIGDDYVTDGPPTNYFTITPTVMVSIPGHYIFRLPGEFQVGTSVACKRYSNISEYEFTVRVRWYVKVSELKDAWKNRHAPRPDPG